LSASAVKLTVPKGTHDLLGAEAAARETVECKARAILQGAGYERIETPTLEATELFARGVGDATDIVQKEMYTLTDGGGRSLTLRPEGTAPVCRAYVEHGMHKRAQPVKLWYLSSFFRYERAQKGRYRQFWQVGAEALGSDDPAVDAESIVLLGTLLEELGVRARLRLSSLGDGASREQYRERLQAHLYAHIDSLSEEVKSRIELNPLRAFDADHEGTRQAMRSAPRLLDHLNDEDREHFACVRALLDDAGLAYDLDTTLVRGLDYYTRTVFEFNCADLGAQSGVGGGGRYDGLVAQLGGQPTPGMGWAAGVERILLAGTPAANEHVPLDVYVALADLPTEDDARGVDGEGGEGSPGPRSGLTPGGSEPGLRDAAGVGLRDAVRRAGWQVLREARAAGLTAQMELAGRSLKGQLKHAQRLGARHVAVVDATGRTVLKDMQASVEAERTLASEALVAELLRERHEL
jgi:histidyl-tRNA synthetase